MKYNAGYRRLLIENDGDPFRALVFYPTDAAPGTLAIGPYTLEVASDAPIADGTYPLVVTSHGGGSSPLVLRGYGIALAKRGFVVAMPEHPGNHRLDNSRDMTMRNAQERPKHITRTIDAIASDNALREHVRTDRVGIIGHSMGGYTALAVAGAQPWWGVGQPVTVESDARVAALILLAPATAWFVADDSLTNVRVPVLVYGAEHDTQTPRWQSQLLEDMLPKASLKAVRIIQNATHYSFLTQFPAHLAGPSFAPSVDLPGFDRVAFQETLYEELAEFFQENIS